MSDRSLPRQAIAAVGLWLVMGLTLWLAGCAEMDGSTGGGPAAAVSAASAAFVAAADASAPASAAQAQQAPAPPDADRFAALVVRALPLGHMLQASLDKDPNWPVGPKAARISAPQLQCLRQRLSPGGYQQSRAQAVNQFMARHPDQVQDAIDVLEQGAADVMEATFKVRQVDRNIALRDVTKNFTQEQISQYNSLTQSDKFKPLRKLLIGDSRPLVGKRAGADVGVIFARQLIRNALDACQVPLSALQ